MLDIGGLETAVFKLSVRGTYRERVESIKRVTTNALNLLGYDATIFEPANELQLGFFERIFGWFVRKYWGERHIDADLIFLVRYQREQLNKALWDISGVLTDLPRVQKICKAMYGANESLCNCYPADYYDAQFEFKGMDYLRNNR